jgi:uncharacterized alpha-E superfamily protein
MLSRTADHLYWMSRYIERAENLARLVDAHYRMSLLPHQPESLAESLRATMSALYVEGAYRERYKDIEPSTVFEFLTVHRDFNGSILNCLKSARENARAVRGSLTSELWETLNSTWLDARAHIATRAAQVDVGGFIEWVKERSHLTRGVTVGTMVRDEAFYFTRLGTFIERADSTARILIAYQADLMPGAAAARVPDPYAWSVLLRALSAFEVYRRVFRDVITPVRVANLLILRDDMPRSLLRCCKEVYANLRSVANEQSAETERRAGEIHAMLHFGRMEELSATGIPSFLQRFLERLHDLMDRVSSDFLVPPAEG